jgi:hypothetical protein
MCLQDVVGTTTHGYWERLEQRCILDFRLEAGASPPPDITGKERAFIAWTGVLVGGMQRLHSGRYTMNGETDHFLVAVFDTCPC